MKKLEKLKFDKQVINELTKEEQKSIKGGDFDTPTIHDSCWSSGSSTFRDACQWCGFFHSTENHL